MEWIRFAAFLAATTYLPGRAFSRLAMGGSSPVAADLATGLAVGLILCALPFAFAPWALLALALASAVVLWRRKNVALEPRDRSLVPLLALFPGAALALVSLSLGPFQDAFVASDGAISYRTEATIGVRSAGVYPVLAESALLVSRIEGGGDPFVSGEPLPRLDPRRTYLALALRFSGIQPYLFTGKVVPALLLVAVLGSIAVALPDANRSRARALLGIFLFGSGLAALAAIVPIVRSWPFRIWAYLGESTGFADLLTEPAIALLLFLSMAGFTDERRALIVAAAILLSEPSLGVPLLIASTLYAVGARIHPFGKLAILAAAGAGVVLSDPTPLAPLLRSIEYNRLDHLQDLALRPSQTLAIAALFLLVSLGAGVLGVVRSVSVLASPAEGSRALHAWTAALFLSGFLGLPASGRAWSLALLLLSIGAAELFDRGLGRRPRGGVLLALSAVVAISLAGSADYLRHYRRAERKLVSASDAALARKLGELALPGEPVLHRPNRNGLSLASHVSLRPAVVCYYGRRGWHDSSELEARSRDVRAFFESATASEARAIAEKYGVRFVLVEKDRPPSFGEASWLRWTAENENLALGEVN